jgi:hypothetical protein
MFLLIRRGSIVEEILLRSTGFSQRAQEEKTTISAKNTDRAKKKTASAQAAEQPREKWSVICARH